jgi:glucose 1-dehydrogenase
MLALTVTPGKSNSLDLENVGPPPVSDGAVLVRMLTLGICGTDLEIIRGDYGWSPPGSDQLIIGHESLGIVEEAPAGCGFTRGDLVVGIVRRPDPVPCAACAAGEWDMCRNGRYTERGIKERNGYGSELVRVEPEFLVKIDSALGHLGVLTEPASVIAKAWEQTLRSVSRSFTWDPHIVLVTGAGPVGLLAALLAVQLGLEVHVFDRIRVGPKPELVNALGAIYHTDAPEHLRPDIVIECTGASTVVLDVIARTSPDGVVCLAGVSSGGRELAFDAGAFNRTIVLENHVVFGSVSANRHHYQTAAKVLAQADQDWLSRLITRRTKLKRWREAFHRNDDDIKVVIDFAG